LDTEKVQLLRNILTLLDLEELPQSMVQRRIAVTKAFEQNIDKFHEPDFV
jgi:hypothetical protein